MFDIILGFVGATTIVWLTLLICIWILEKFATILGFNFFIVSTSDWIHGWKSWVFTMAFVLLCTLTEI